MSSDTIILETDDEHELWRELVTAFARWDAHPAQRADDQLMAYRKRLPSESAAKSAPTPERPVPHKLSDADLAAADRESAARHETSSQAPDCGQTPTLCVDCNKPIEGGGVIAYMDCGAVEIGPMHRECDEGSQAPGRPGCAELSQRDREVIAEMLEDVGAQLYGESKCGPGARDSLLEVANALLMDVNGDWVEMATRITRARDEMHGTIHLELEDKARAILQRNFGLGGGGHIVDDALVAGQRYKGVKDELAQVRSALRAAGADFADYGSLAHAVRWLGSEPAALRERVGGIVSEMERRGPACGFSNSHYYATVIARLRAALQGDAKEGEPPEDSVAPAPLAHHPECNKDCGWQVIANLESALAYNRAELVDLRKAMGADDEEDALLVARSLREESQRYSGDWAEASYKLEQAEVKEAALRERVEAVAERIEAVTGGDESWVDECAKSLRAALRETGR